MIWKPIPGYARYEVSDEGDIRRVAPAKGATVGALIKPQLDRKGYHRATLTADDGKRYSVGFHVAVALAFLGPRTAPQVRHLDGCPAHNWKGNLAWGTNAENQADRCRHGTDNGTINARRKREHHSQGAAT